MNIMGIPRWGIKNRINAVQKYLQYFFGCLNVILRTCDLCCSAVAQITASRNLSARLKNQQRV